MLKTPEDLIGDDQNIADFVLHLLTETENITNGKVSHSESSFYLSFKSMKDAIQIQTQTVDALERVLPKPTEDDIFVLLPPLMFVHGHEKNDPIICEILPDSLFVVVIEEVVIPVISIEELNPKLPDINVLTAMYHLRSPTALDQTNIADFFT